MVPVETGASRASRFEEPPDFPEEVRQISFSNIHHNVVLDRSTSIDRPALILRLEAHGVSNHIFDDIRKVPKMTTDFQDKVQRLSPGVPIVFQ